MNETNANEIVDEAIAVLDDIEMAIKEKGVDVSEDTPSSDYDDKIRSIPSGDIAIDQTYKPTSENAQSGKAVAEAVTAVEDKIGDIETLNTPTEKILVNAINYIKTHCEEASYEAFNLAATVEMRVGWLIELNTIDKTNTVAAINELVGNIDSLGTQMGDIDTALDNIIAMQNSYIGGDSV